MTHYPLVFHYKNWIQGPGFAAGVELVGQVLLYQEDGEWWLSGVTPGGMSEAGKTPQAAYTGFRAFFTGILTDFADRAGNFQAFETEVKRFMAQTNKADANRWEEARAAIKAGGAVEPSLGSMQKLTGAVVPHLLQCVQLVPNQTPHAEPEEFVNYSLAQAA